MFIIQVALGESILFNIEVLLNSVNPVPESPKTEVGVGVGVAEKDIRLCSLEWKANDMLTQTMEKLKLYSC